MFYGDGSAIDSQHTVVPVYDNDDDVPSQYQHAIMGVPGRLYSQGVPYAEVWLQRHRRCNHGAIACLMDQLRYEMGMHNWQLQWYTTTGDNVIYVRPHTTPLVIVEPHIIEPSYYIAYRQQLVLALMMGMSVSPDSSLLTLQDPCGNLYYLPRYEILRNTQHTIIPQKLLDEWFSDCTPWYVLKTMALRKWPELTHAADVDYAICTQYGELLNTIINRVDGRLSWLLTPSITRLKALVTYVY